MFLTQDDANHFPQQLVLLSKRSFEEQIYALAGKQGLCFNTSYNFICVLFAYCAKLLLKTVAGRHCPNKALQDTPQYHSNLILSSSYQTMTSTSNIKPFLPSSRPSGPVFIGLNALRALSIIALLLVFAANIETMVS